MRFPLQVSIVATLSLLHTSCGPTGQMVTMTGETATIILHNGSKEIVELLAVEDSAVLCLAQDKAFAADASSAAGRVRIFPVGSISLIEVSGFRNNNWWMGIVFFQLLPAAGLGVAAASVDADAGAVFLVASIPALFTAFLYGISGLPTPTFRDPITNESLAELRKYARFGATLTPPQREQLLRTHGQEGMRR